MKQYSSLNPIHTNKTAFEAKLKLGTSINQDRSCIIYVLVLTLVTVKCIVCFFSVFNISVLTQCKVHFSVRLQRITLKRVLFRRRVQRQRHAPVIPGEKSVGMIFINSLAELLSQIKYLKVTNLTWTVLVCPDC